VKKQTIIEGAAQSAPVHHVSGDGRPWAVLTVDCGSWVRVVLFGEQAQRGALPWLQRGSPVRCAGRISVRSGDVRNRGQQMQIELIADAVAPLAEPQGAVLP
jgi:hypothetical protein